MRVPSPYALFLGHNDRLILPKYLGGEIMFPSVDPLVFHDPSLRFTLSAWKRPGVIIKYKHEVACSSSRDKQAANAPYQACAG